MKRIPDAELELMMVIWDSDQPVSRMDIETKMENHRDVVPSTILLYDGKGLNEKEIAELRAFIDEQAGTEYVCLVERY
ncbi:MAG: hypothetical protein K2G51_15815 [Lachnospiraceae bacterium]|nr:hypothetical protein [Lachnospiraceae bacterium]